MILSALRARSRHRRYEADFRASLGCFSQDDMAVANAAGATVRADINSNLQALASNHSGSSAPSTTYAYQWWADTTSGLQKQRNAANTGWLVRGSLTEAFVVSRSSNTILAVADFGKVIDATAAFTQTLTAAATLGDGWYVDFLNDATTDCTIDPNASETINGATTLLVPPGCGGRIWCNGAAFFMKVAPNDVRGTFTPTITLGGAAVGVTYTTQSGRYVKRGNVVHFWLSLVLSSKGSSTGSLLINALPFTSTNDFARAITVRLAGSLGSIAVCQGYVNTNATTISLEKLVAGSATVLADTDIGNTSQITLSGSYET